MHTTSRLRFSLLAGCGLLLLALAAMLAWRSTPVATWLPGGLGTAAADRQSGSVSLVTLSDGLSGAAIDASGVVSPDAGLTGTGSGRSAGTLSLGGQAATSSGGQTYSGDPTGSSTQFGSSPAVGTSTQFGTASLTGTGVQTGTSTQTGSTTQFGSSAPTETGGTGQGGNGQGGNGQGGNGQGGGGIPPGEGTTTPELPSGILVGLGLVPLLLGIAWFRRQRSGLDAD